MTGDHHGQTAGTATLLVKAVDEIVGTHRLAPRVGVAAGTSRHPGMETERQGYLPAVRADRVRMPISRALKGNAILSHTGAATDPSGADRHRDVLLVVLTLTTGALDAVTFVRLGKVFSSVITGNLALLGVAAGQQDTTLALNAGLALAGYAAGVIAGAALAGTPQPGQPAWPVQVTRTLAIESGVLAAFSILWLAAGGHPADGDRLALLMLAAAAMGMQSTAVRRLGQISTTYLTSTLTGILTGLALRRWPEDWGRSTGILAMAVIGAALGALAATRSSYWVPAAVLIPIAAVLARAPWTRQHSSLPQPLKTL
jgi:uncharacterized membrane protein YoaK (UPF0700 family)